VLWLLASKTAVAEADVDCPLKFEAILLAIAPGPSSQSQGQPEGNERHLLPEQHKSPGESTAAATKTKKPTKVHIVQNGVPAEGCISCAEGAASRVQNKPG
jgi:hypothetical protein